MFPVPHLRRLSLTLVLAVCSPGPLTAQVGGGEVGMYLVTAAGGAGTICPRTFSCTFLPATLTRGETITIAVRGVQNQPYVVLVGAAARPLCLSIPGVLHELMFEPLLLPFAGLLDTPDRILACPGGLKELQLPIPTQLPPGAVLSFQALAVPDDTLWPQIEVPTFTMAVQATVR